MVIMDFNHCVSPRDLWAQRLFKKDYLELNRKDSRIVQRKINGKKDTFKL